MASQGPNATGTSVNDAGTGTLSWASPGNATTSNNTYASVTGSSASSLLLAGD